VEVRGHAWLGQRRIRNNGAPRSPRDVFATGYTRDVNSAVVATPEDAREPTGLRSRRRSRRPSPAAGTRSNPTAGEIAQAIGPWRSRPGPLYNALAAALRSLIHQGVLGSDVRLPAERVLSQELHVGRGTVIAAYAALRSQGLLQTTRGSGTVVHAGGRQSSTAHAALLSRLLIPGQTAIDLTVSAPGLLDDLAAVGTSCAELARRLPQAGCAPLGLPELRFAIAARMTRSGVRTAPEQILITNGFQGALSLIADAFIARGDLVATEAPTNPAALDRDENGVKVEPLEHLLSSEAVRLVSLASGVHAPTGATTSALRAQRVLRALESSRATIVDDGSASDVWLDRPPAGLWPAATRVIHIGSFRRSLWAGLRIGWVRAGEEVILRLGRLATGRDLGPSAVEQSLLLHAMPRLDELFDRRRELAARRLRALTTELNRLLPAWELSRPRGGWQLWIRLPGGNGDALAQHALRHGVAVAPGSATAPDARFADHIAVSFTADEPTLKRAVGLLALAWRDYCG
jgi:DNA-binding transcriptional MocR family regulator